MAASNASTASCVSFPVDNHVDELVLEADVPKVRGLSPRGHKKTIFTTTSLPVRKKQGSPAGRTRYVMTPPDPQIATYELAWQADGPS